MSINRFSDWLETLPPNTRERLPLTHVAKFSIARDIIQSRTLKPKFCDTLKGDFAFAFYGRSAYRIRVDGTVTSETLSPICFVIENSDDLAPAKRHPFDSGAFGALLYSKTLQSDSKLEDFEIVGEIDLQDRLIDAFFISREKYIDGDPSGIRSVDDICTVDQCEVRDYHNLATAKGTNQPDDRMHTVEYCFDAPVGLQGKLKAVVVPDVLWREEKRSEFLDLLDADGVDIATYRFVPGRGVEYYQSLVEGSLRDLLVKWGYYA